jgi:hypothetical protein
MQYFGLLLYCAYDVLPLLFRNQIFILYQVSLFSLLSHTRFAEVDI